MPEHVHLIVSESEQGALSTAIQALKVSVAKRASSLNCAALEPGAFWQKRYYDHNIRTYEKFVEKLRYIHRNPVKRELVEKPEDWSWSSFLQLCNWRARSSRDRVGVDGSRSGSGF